MFLKIFNRKCERKNKRNLCFNVFKESYMLLCLQSILYQVPPPSLNIPDCAKVLHRPLLIMFCLENEKWVQRFIETWQHVYEKTQFVHFQ